MYILRRKNFFSNRVAYAWISLPNSCIKSVSINQFKANIDNMDKVDLEKVLGEMKSIKTLY